MSSPRPNSFGTQCVTTLSEQPRVLLVDDNQAILDRASMVLSPACEIVGRAKDGPAALEAARMFLAPHAPCVTPPWPSPPESFPMASMPFVVSNLEAGYESRMARWGIARNRAVRGSRVRQT